jgi:hypothetical protein
LLAVLLPTLGMAGIFAPPAGEAGSSAVPATDPEIDGWATGYQNYVAGPEADATFRTPAKALGPAGNSNGNVEGFVFDIVSLGRGGSITLSFSPPMANGPGFDFAVFENAINDTFLEFATVEVSSDGVNFVAFPPLSQVPAPVSSFGAVDATDVEQLAGKYRGGFGTPFDLGQLAGSPGLDLSRVRYVRLTDVVGDGTAANALTPQTLADYLGIPLAELPQALIDIANAAPASVYDPYPTFESAGFDLDAVAVLEQAPMPVSLAVDPFGTDPIDPDSTGLLPVLIYSTSIANGDLDEFDATAIDSASLLFGVTGAAPQGAPFTVDFDGDGLTDAGYVFPIQDTGIACEDTQVPLNGTTVSGVEFAGSGAVITTDCGTNTCHP